MFVCLRWNRKKRFTCRVYSGSHGVKDGANEVGERKEQGIHPSAAASELLQCHGSIFTGFHRVSLSSSLFFMTGT